MSGPISSHIWLVGPQLVEVSACWRRCATMRRQKPMPPQLAFSLLHAVCQGANLSCFSAVCLLPSCSFPWWSRTLNPGTVSPINSSTSCLGHCVSSEQQKSDLARTYEPSSTETFKRPEVLGRKVENAKMLDGAALNSQRNRDSQSDRATLPSTQGFQLQMESVSRGSKQCATG